MIHGIFLPHTQRNHHAFIVDGVTQTVQTANRGHHDHVPPLKKCGRGTVTQAVNLLIDGRILFDIGVRMGNIGFRLIVVVVGDEILHRVIWKKLPKLGA